MAEIVKVMLILTCACASLQLDDIPGEVESEKGHKDTITN